jgi:hypothetical protein
MAQFGKALLLTPCIATDDDYKVAYGNVIILKLGCLTLRRKK